MRQISVERPAEDSIGIVRPDFHKLVALGLENLDVTFKVFQSAVIPPAVSVDTFDELVNIRPKDEGRRRRE